MPEIWNRVGQGLAKTLNIELDYANEAADRVLQSQSFVSSQATEIYIEEEPSVLDWIQEKVPSCGQLLSYLASIFPFTRWIFNYNLQWLIGDLVAGITIGVVVVPQGMAYAILAGLPPQYGLYTSFIGVLVYWFFATSKDITIGPVAVMSILLGDLALEARESHPEIPATVITSATSVLCGIAIFFLGLFRCGWIIEMIPNLSISAFLTGSAINISISQLPGLMGLRGFPTRAPTYQVLINTIKHLPKMQMDAAIGLSALSLLYFIRWVCTFIANRAPSKKKLFFFLLSLRTVFVIFLYTMISWLVNRHHRSNPLFKILSTVPAGFTAAGVPVINKTIISLVISQVPTIVIVILIEHIAVGKSFGRVNNYTIDPSQEMIAIGITNILGPFVGGFCATGSFSRTSINSKANVRTPFAGVITAVVVLLAIYVLPAMFFYIPSSALCAVIIHAVLDLVAPPNTVYQFWRISPSEVPIFFAGVFVTIFSSIENGIYTTILASSVLLLVRFINARGTFLGRVEVYSSVGEPTGKSSTTEKKKPFGLDNGTFVPQPTSSNKNSFRNIFPPLDRSDGINPKIIVQPPKPGVFIYRFSESFNYPNANHYLDHFTSCVFANTRRTNKSPYARPGDRPWNDPAPRKNRGAENVLLPTLKAIIFDFSAVNFVDVTSIQRLVDVREQLDRYASPNIVNWHFCNIKNRWTKRALVAAGFGYPSIPVEDLNEWKPIFNITKIGDQNISSHENGEKEIKKNGRTSDLENLSSPHMALVGGINRPLFHPDLTSAWLSAVEYLDEEQIGENKPSAVTFDSTLVTSSEDS
ncbi:Sulfate permease 2 [Podosphaera aphanis]|nr:Sulfate permease 2 [Podosphaera aphanis]